MGVRHSSRAATLLRRGAVAATALALASLDLSEVAGGESDPAASAPARGRAPGAAEHPRDHRRRDAGAALVSARRDARPAAAEHRGPPARRGLVRAPLHRRQQLHAVARGALVTGLYSHQTGCLVTGRSELEPGFPTWGTLLREHGYQTTWWGKWHLSSGADARAVGVLRRHLPVAQRRAVPGPPRRSAHRGAVRAVVRRRGRRRPLVHDGVVRQPARHRLVVDLHASTWPAERSAPRYFSRLPGNFETPAELIARGKPRLQLLAPGRRGVGLRRGAVQRPRGASRAGASSATSISSSSATSTPRSAACCGARQPARDRARHDRDVHLRPRRVRRLARAARQGRRRLRRGHPGAAATSRTRAAC